MSNSDSINAFDDELANNEVLFSRAMDMSNSPSKTELDILNSTNPLYEEYKDSWSFYLDAYEGGYDFISNSNIFSHIRENPDDYKDRVRRAVYFNYMQPLVNFFSNFIFSEEIARFGGAYDDQFQRFIKDVNGKGESIDLFMREVCDLNQIFGHIDILVDKKQNTTGSNTLSLLQEQELGLANPYFLILYPHEVLDWKFSETGGFVYLKRCVCDGDYKTYTSWGPNKIIKVIVKSTNNKEYIEDVREFENTLGEVPVVRSYYRKSKKHRDMGNSFLTDISVINRRIMNLSSLLDEFLFRQCVTGDTLIDCPRDLEKYPYGIPIKELVGKEFMTYSWDISRQQYVLRKAYDVRKTGEKQPVYRLNFSYKDEYNQDKLGYLDATGNHPVLLQHGEYKDLKDLKEGEKLVPFYRWMDGYPRGNRPHILQTLSFYSGISEHRFIVQESGEVLLNKHHIHHKDGRSLNNNIDNLEQITEEQHKILEAEKISERTKKWWREASEVKKRAVTTKALAGIKKWHDENPEDVRRAYRNQSRSIKKTLNKLTVEERKQKVAKALEVRDHVTSMEALHKGQKEWWINLSEKERTKRMQRMRDKKKEKANHVVVSIEFLGYEDVYNLEVEDTYNYVANGIVVHNCFNSLAKQVDSSIPFKDQNDGSIGTSNVIEVPRGAEFPKYISPPVDPAQFLQSEREKNILEIYRIASQDTAMEVFTGQSRSGDAQSQSFHKVTPYISSRAENLEKTEVALARLWLKWINPSAVWNGKINYKDDYSALSIINRLLELKMIFTDIKVPSITFVKEELRKVVKEFDSKMAPEDMKKVLEEIDQNVTQEYVDNMQGAKTGANNLRGIASTAQLEQGQMQEMLGSNEKISAKGADNVV